MSIPLPSIKVLFVDDEPALQALGEDLLVEEGYEVVCAAGAREALDLFAQHGQQVDLVVTDESMPGMTGIELAQQLFKLAPQLPIILCSGYLLTMAEEGIAATNIKAVLAKTDIFFKLPATIASLLAQDR
ncbi:response regulator [Pelovirga terrestris]|uniref:Response regulator n=1 Tax=Pelovirga terrestris TaxID=2771352 RepID=A0A8J6UKY8_9BACT|nr:response regulator [Pelovirga terrestris]MBD1400262.1 response regulator [Pelovirga terrestris]